MQKSQNSKNNSKLNISHFSHNISNTQDFNISSNNISKIQQQQELLYSQYNNPLKLMQKESENFGDILRQLICKKCSLIIQNAPISCSSCQKPVYCANCFNEIQSQKKQKNSQNTHDCPKCQQHFKPDYQIHKSYEENFQQLTKKVMKIKNVVFSKYNNIIVWDQFKKIKISNFRPVKDSLYTREYIVFKIDFDSSYVERRYTDFLALHQHLLKQYQGHIIPKLPPKHSIENKVQQAVGDYGYTQQFLNERRENLEIFLQLIYGNKNFKDDIILKNFLLQPKFEHPEDTYYQECVHTLLAGAQNLNDTIDFGIAYLSVKFSNPVLKYSDITPQNIAKINKLSENIYKLCQMVQQEQKQLEQIYNCLLVVQSNPQNLFKNLFNTKNQMEQEEEDIYQSIDSLKNLKDQNKIKQKQKQEQNQKLDSQILQDSGLQGNDENYLFQEQQSLIQKSVLMDQSLLIDKQSKINNKNNNNKNSQIEQEKQQNEDNNKFLTEENFQNKSFNSSFQYSQENQDQNLNTSYIERKIENCKEMRILNKFLLTKIDIIWRRIEGLHFATQTIIIHFDDIQARASIRDKKRAAQKYDEERKIVEQINILAQQLKNMTQRLEKDSTDLLNTIRVEFNNIIRQFKLLKIWETLIQVRPDDLFSTSEIIREYEERDKRYYLRDIKNQEFEEIDEQDLIAIQLNIDKDDINKTNKSQNQNYQMQEIEVDDNQYIEKPIKILNSNKINSKNKDNDQLNLSEIQQDQDGIYRDNLLFEQALHNEDEEIEIMLQKQLKGNQKSFEQIEQIEKEELNPQQEQDLHNLIFNSMNGKKQQQNDNEEEEENKNNSFQNEQKPNKQQKKNEFDYSPDIISSQAPQNQNKNNKELEMNLEQMENSSLCSQNNDFQQEEIEQDLNQDNESEVSQNNSANQNNSKKNQLSQSNNSPMETESEHESESDSGNQKRSQKQKNSQENFLNKTNSENQNLSQASKNLSQNGAMNQDQNKNQTKSQIQIQNLSLNFNENQNQNKNQNQQFQPLTLQKNIVTSQLIGTIQAHDHPQRLTKSGQIQELENQQNQLNNSYYSPEFQSSEKQAQKQKEQKLKYKKFKNFQDQSEEESEEGENREEEEKEEKEQNEDKINFAQSKNQNSQNSSQYNKNSINNSIKRSSNNNSSFNQNQNIKKKSDYLSSFHQSQKKFKEDSLNFENSDYIPSQLKQSQSESSNNQMYSSQNNQNIQNSNYKQFNEESKNSEKFQNTEQNINQSQQSQQICSSSKSEDMQQSVFLHPQKLQQDSGNFLDFNFPHLKNLDAKNQQLNKENNENHKQTILNLQNLNLNQFDQINKSQNLNNSHPIQNILHSQKIDLEEMHNKLNKSKGQEFVSNQQNIQSLNLIQQNSQKTISLHHQPQSQPQSQPQPQAQSYQNPLANSKLNKQNSQNSFPSLGLSEFPLIPNPNFQNNYQDNSQILDPMKMNKNCSLNMDLGIESGESMKLSMEIVNQIQQNLRVSDQKSKKIQSNNNPIQNEKNHPILKINNQFQQVNINEQIDERSENSQEMSDTIQFRKKQSSSSVENSINKKQKLQNHKSLNLYDNIGPLDYTKSYDPNSSQKIEQLLQLNSKNPLDKSNSLSDPKTSKQQHKSYFVKNPKSLFKPKENQKNNNSSSSKSSSNENENNFQYENQNQNQNENLNQNLNENENQNQNCKTNIDLGQSLELQQQQSFQQQEFQNQNNDSQSQNEEQQYFQQQQQFSDSQKLQSLNQSQKLKSQQLQMQNSQNKSHKSIDSSQFQNQDLHNKIEQAEKQLEQLNQIKQQNLQQNKSQNSLSSSDDEQDFFDAKEDFQDDFKNEEEDEKNNNNIEFVDIQNQNQKENNKKYDFTNYQQFLNSIQDLNLKKLFLCISLIPNQVQEKNILNLSQSLQQSQQDYIEQFVDKFFQINWKKMELENKNKKINMKEIYNRFFSNQSYFSDFSQMNYQNFFSYLIQEFIDETLNFKSSNLYPEIQFENLNNLENNDQYKIERNIQFQVKKSQNASISNKKFQITQCIYPLSVQLIFIENIIEISQINQQYEQNEQEIYPLTAKVYYLLEENQNNNINNNDISIQMGSQILINNQDNFDIQEIYKISHFIEEKWINNFKNQIQQEVQTSLNQIQKQQEQNQFKNQYQDNQMISDSLI
ncbi:Phox homologous domain [Pseudocohnilembus persalinus]|uniref:Phox homologous domain n=1 Tax=Pseudocohnilembus persalinus TaxID=266149 RepID=A0A0V0QKW9_PSEPJ|nr:Phox homologous domain [Pseudocohnilembus persalinus]|eukprot:KRX02712.1 Phox homologous domain [Pseudocohnilembus persalinus]